ncbi:unnamed protein product [Rotaria sp. Silwood2]|nr:unnamed protein product [Rotaria sp. Silwood2]CAF4365070.1 unnamed protein product [Rotaria sp. Silwood2]
MTFYLLLILLLLLYQHTNVQAGNSALCFLTERPSFETIEFAQELAQDAIEYDLDVFIMIDDNNFNISTINILSNVRLIQISNQECVHYGYQKTISLTSTWREITSWDKTLLYFTLLNNNYTFVWLIENDVFIPSVQAFSSLHQLYSNTSDLIVPRNEINLLGNTSTWLWSMEVGKLILPWSCSMVNVVGLSRRMLIAIADYVHWLGEVPFHEFFFNTLAMHLNMTIVTPTELSTIVYQTFYSLEQIFKQPNNLWHPFKDLAKRKLWRKMLVNESLKNNNTIQLIDLEVLCHNNQSMRNIEQYLTNLLIKFEKYKSQLSSVIRVSLRQNFCNLAEQCEKQNASKEVISLIKKLADHAYKLPELPVEKLIITKSKHHLKLEQALEENKKTIFRLLSNSSTVVELRKQTNYLIKELTLEIKREFNEQQEFQNYTEESSLSFSFVTTPISTVGSSDVIFSTEMTTMKINKRFYVLTIQNENRIFDSIDDNTKILFLIFSFCTLFILFQWKKI